MVGALLVEPTDPECATGVIFFDAEAVLGMCGHGTIGLTVTLAHLGRIGLGAHKIETPVGVVEVQHTKANTVAVKNIESRRVHTAVSVEVEGLGLVTGDVAYSGNWFFIVDPSPVSVTPKNLRALTDATIAVREAVIAQGVCGEDGQPIDHVIFQEPSSKAGVHSQNFVLCPDDTYDRSPCGTGSSARLACLAADGRLAEGQEIVQESVIGRRYRISYQPGESGGIVPTIKGHGFVVSKISGGVRVGGAIELGGLDLPPHYKRSEILLHKAAQFLPQLKTEGGQQWMGFRPSMPDSLPVIDHSPKTRNIIYAFGHGHLGQTQAAGTAELVTSLTNGTTPEMPLEAFSATRF